MHERPDGPGTLRVEIRSYRVSSIDDLLASVGCDLIVDVARFSTRAQADHKAFGSIARTPSGDLSIQRVERALRSCGRFRNDVEFLADLDFEIIGSEASFTSKA